MVMLCSFFVDVALKLWKASSAGRSRAGWRRNRILRKKSKDQTQLNCKGVAAKKPQYFISDTLKYLSYHQLKRRAGGCPKRLDLPARRQKIHHLNMHFRKLLLLIVLVTPAWAGIVED